MIIIINIINSIQYSHTIEVIEIKISNATEELWQFVLQYCKGSIEILKDPNHRVPAPDVALGLFQCPLGSKSSALIRMATKVRLKNVCA